MWSSFENESSIITFTWNIENITNIGYDTIGLYEMGGTDLLSDLLIENDFSTSFQANELRQFQIIGQSSEPNGATEESDYTTLIIIAIIFLVIIVLIIVFLKRIFSPERIFQNIFNNIFK